MLSEEAPPPLDVNKKRSRGSKSAKRDSKSAKMVTNFLSSFL